MSRTKRPQVGQPFVLREHHDLVLSVARNERMLPRDIYNGVIDRYRGHVSEHQVVLITRYHDYPLDALHRASCSRDRMWLLRELADDLNVRRHALLSFLVDLARPELEARAHNLNIDRIRPRTRTTMNVYLPIHTRLLMAAHAQGDSGPPMSSGSLAELLLEGITVQDATRAVDEADWGSMLAHGTPRARSVRLAPRAYEQVASIADQAGISHTKALSAILDWQITELELNTLRGVQVSEGLAVTVNQLTLDAERGAVQEYREAIREFFSPTLRGLGQRLRKHPALLEGLESVDE